MRRFKWIDWNRQKIANHSLSTDEVEAAFDKIHKPGERDDGSFESIMELPNGRIIKVIWCFDRDDEEIPDVFGELPEPPIFVVTAY